VLALLVGIPFDNASGSLNKPLYLVIVVVGFVITAMFLRSSRARQLDKALAVVASIGLVWGIWTIERPALIAYFWEGFGARVGLGVVLLLGLLAVLLFGQVFPRWLRLGLGLVVAVCAVCDVLSLIRTFDFMPIVTNNVNEVNDVLGPAAGNAPSSTFIPQYTDLYGWLFAPLDHLLSPNQLVGTIAIFFTLLGIACLLLAIWVTRRALGTRGFILAIAFVVPITCVTSHAGESTSIGSLFQELPIRILSGFIIAALGLHDLTLLYRGTLRAIHVLLLGFVCGVVAWNSQDFGVAAAGVYGLMILLGGTRSVRLRALSIWSAGLVVGVASYPLFLLAIGSPLNLSFVGAFVKLFASGFGLVPIQVPGPVLVIMPIVVSSVAAGWALLRIRHRPDARADALLDRATITLTFIGTWSAISLVYYVNRAFAAGQLQTMLLPCGVCVASLFSILIHTVDLDAPGQPRRVRDLWDGLSTHVNLAPLGVFVSLCFAATVLTLNPVAAVTNVVKPPRLNGYSDFGLPQILSAVRLAQAYTETRSGELTYLGESFNYVALTTHVQTNALFFPEVDPVIVQIQCQYLHSHRSRWMVLSLDGLHAYGTAACGMYRPVALQGLTLGQLQELK
jgi:hypothetical protein